MLVVLGNACRDITYRVAALPTAGETAIASHVATDLGGKGFNQAIAARRAGQSVRFLAPVGNDATAQDIRDSLVIEGIDPASLIVRDGQSDSSIILVDAKGENFIISNTSRAEALRPEDILPLLKLESKDTLLLQGNLSQETTTAAIAAARQAGASTVLNAAPFRNWLPHIANDIDVLIVNRLEAYLWAGLNPSHTLEHVMEATDVETLVVTLGSKGCQIRNAEGRITAIPSPAVKAIDTTCAGDIFTGTFVEQWISSGNSLRAATLAVCAASDKVTRQGSYSAFPTALTISLLTQNLESGWNERKLRPSF
jgi:ribokinase